MDVMSQQIQEYERMLHGIVNRIMHSPSSQLRDELIQAGRVGVWEAIKTHDISKGSSLRNYAGRKATWAMQEYLRSCDHMVRSQRRAKREGDESVVDPIALSHSQSVDGDHEIIDCLASDDATPYHYLVADEAFTVRANVIKNHRHGEMAISHIVHGSTLLELAGQRKLTESRICQLMSEVKRRILANVDSVEVGNNPITSLPKLGLDSKVNNKKLKFKLEKQANG